MSDVLTEDAKVKALGNAAGGPGGDTRSIRGTESATPHRATLAVDLAVCGRTLGSMLEILDPRRRRVERLSPIEDAMA